MVWCSVPTPAAGGHMSPHLDTLNIQFFLERVHMHMQWDCKKSQVCHMLALQASRVVASTSGSCLKMLAWPMKMLASNTVRDSQGHAHHGCQDPFTSFQPVRICHSDCMAAHLPCCRVLRCSVTSGIPQGDRRFYLYKKSVPESKGVAGANKIPCLLSTSLDYSIVLQSCSTPPDHPCLFTNVLLHAKPVRVHVHWGATTGVDTHTLMHQASKLLWISHTKVATRVSLSELHPSCRKVPSPSASQM